MKISQTISLHLVRSSVGRIILHVVCLARDGHLRWHWQGIRNEFRPRHFIVGTAS